MPVGKYQVSLDEAVQQALNLGDIDPYEVAKRVKRRYGNDWLAEQLLEMAEEIIAETARRYINSRRASALRSDAIEKKDRNTARKAEGELLLQAKWIPGVGYKRIGDLTVDDLVKVRDHYRVLMDAASIRVELCETWIARMKQHKARTLAGLAKKIELPSLEELTG